MPPANERSPDASAAAYSPALYLLSITGLSRDELIAQYEEFRQSLRHVETAPEFVFERLVANLREAFFPTLTQERDQHATEKEAWRDEKIRLVADLAIARSNAAPIPAEQPRVSSPAYVPASVPPEEPGINTYLQFWFTSIEGSFVAHAAATSVPVPYGNASGRPNIDPEAPKATIGNYDSRTDMLCTASMVPSTITHLVRFKHAFESLPRVAVWLTGLSAAPGAAVSVKALAINVTETEFTLHISSGDGARLASVGAAWAIWPPATPYAEEINVDSVNTIAPRSARVPVLAGNVILRSRRPVALLALCEVDLVLAGGVWIEVFVPGWAFGSGDQKWSMNAGPGGACVYVVKVVYATYYPSG